MLIALDLDIAVAQQQPVEPGFVHPAPDAHRAVVRQEEKRVFIRNRFGFERRVVDHNNYVFCA